MLCACVAPLPNFKCHIHIPTSLPILPYPSHRRRRLKPNSVSLSKCQTHSKNLLSITLHPTNNSNNKDQQNYYTGKNTDYSHPIQNHFFFDRFQSSVDGNSINNKNPETQNQVKEHKIEEKRETLTNKPKGLFTNMWWVDLKAALGQRINVEGIVSSVSVFVKDQHLALPHVSVRDVRYIDWVELQRRGFKGVVFDKDNTITVPYSLTLCDRLQSSIGQCKSVFGNNLAVFSNSAGLFEYDHDGSKARALEKAIGIKVIRHRVKKPAGTAEEIEKHFGCKSTQLIMVGDRPFTDVVYGNRNGFLTILSEPLSHSQEPFIVRQVRKLEMSLTSYWYRRGLKPVSHNLLPDAMRCIKDLTPL